MCRGAVRALVRLSFAFHIQRGSLLFVFNANSAWRAFCALSFTFHVQQGSLLFVFNADGP